jgi:hypothetical protein
MTTTTADQRDEVADAIAALETVARIVANSRNRFSEGEQVLMCGAIGRAVDLLAAKPPTCEQHGTALDDQGYCDSCTESAADELVAAVMTFRAEKAARQPHRTPDCPVCYGSGYDCKDCDGTMTSNARAAIRCRCAPTGRHARSMATQSTPRDIGTVPGAVRAPATPKSTNCANISSRRGWHPVAAVRAP